MKKIYFNNYPDININFTSDQSSSFPFIKDFNNALLENGLIRVTDGIQLDVNNIPNIPNLHAFQLNNMLDHVVRYTHNPLIYTFNDELNANNPLYLYFYFYFASVNTIAEIFKVSKFNNFLPGILLEIRDKNGIRTPKKHLGVCFSSDNPFNYVTDYIENNHTKNKSYINNIENKFLSMLICPGIFYKNIFNTANITMPKYGSTNYNLFPAVNFILRRYENGEYLLIIGNQNYKAESITQTGTYAPVTRIISYPTTIYNTVSDILLTASSFYNESYVSMADFYNQKKSYAFPLQYYIPGGDGKLIIDDCLLVGNKQSFPETYNALIDIKLDTLINKKYYALSTNFTNMKFNVTDDITLLVREE